VQPIPTQTLRPKTRLGVELSGNGSLIAPAAPSEQAAEGQDHAGQPCANNWAGDGYSNLAYVPFVICAANVEKAI
jgi:hypothetical protein